MILATSKSTRIENVRENYLHLQKEYEVVVNKLRNYKLFLSRKPESTRQALRLFEQKHKLVEELKARNKRLRREKRLLLGDLTVNDVLKDTKHPEDFFWYQKYREKCDELESRNEEIGTRTQGSTKQVVVSNISPGAIMESGVGGQNHRELGEGQTGVTMESYKAMLEQKNEIISVKQNLQESITENINLKKGLTKLYQKILTLVGQVKEYEAKISELEAERSRSLQRMNEERSSKTRKSRVRRSGGGNQVGKAEEIMMKEEEGGGQVDGKGVLFRDEMGGTIVEKKFGEELYNLSPVENKKKNLNPPEKRRSRMLEKKIDTMLEKIFKK